MNLLEEALAAPFVVAGTCGTEQSHDSGVGDAVGHVPKTRVLVAAGT